MNILMIKKICFNNRILWWNLSNLLYEKNSERFNVKEIYSIMSQLNNAFKKMRQNKIVHRDLKLEKILIKYEDNNNNYII